MRDDDEFGRRDNEPFAETPAHKPPEAQWGLSTDASTPSWSSSASPGSFSSSASCCSASSTDTCALLTETDEVLAILDTGVTSAFPTVDNAGTTSAPTGKESSASVALAYGSSGPMTDTSPREQRRSVTSPTKKRQKTPKKELEQLRSAVKTLEAKLTPLQQEKRLATKHNRIWREFATRQFRWRERAEMENQQLKTMLQQVLHATEPQQLGKYYDGADGVAQMMEMANHLPNYIRGSRRPAIASPLRDDAARNTQSVFETLLERLDASFAEIGAVFRENGMDKTPIESRSYAEKRSRRLGETCQFIELVYVDLVPFDWHPFGDAVWECMCEWHLKDDPYVYQSPDRPEDTLAVNYRVTSKSPGNSSGHQQSATCTLAVRRYWLADRFVIVYASEWHGEDELAGASVSDISYVVASNVSSLSEPGSPPVSVVQSCLHLFPSTDGLTEADDQEKAQRLLNLVVDATHEDIAHSRWRVDSALLAGGRPNARGIEEKEDEQILRTRFAFRDGGR